MVGTTLSERPEEVRNFDGFFEALERRRSSLGERAPDLKALSRRRDGRAFLGIAIDWAIVAGAVAVGERLGTWWGYVLAVSVIATRINAFALEWLHEAVHANLFARKGWNEHLDFLYGLPVFAPVAMARRIHIEHHRNYIDESLAPTYTYDYWGLNATNWNDRRRLLWIWWFRPLTGYQTWKFLCFRFADLATSVRYPIRCLAFWGIVVGIFSRFAALHLLLYWFVPLLLIHPVLFFWQDMAQHFNVKKSPTRDVRGAVYRLIFNPHGRGAYHNVHHLHAAIPWFNLRRASEFLIDDATVDIAHGFLDLSRQITSVRPEALLRANASNPRL